MTRPLALLLLSAAQPAPLAAEAPAILVTGRALPALDRPAPGATILDADELALPGRRLEEALAQAPGFQLFRRTNAETASPTAQGLSWRGLGGNASSRAGVLLDGVPQADPFAGWVAWPALSMLGLETAEIDRTPGARWGGSAALAGTVRLASAPPAQRLVLEAGEGGRLGVEGGVVLPLGPGLFLAEGGVRRSDGALIVAPAAAGPIDRPAGFAQWTGRGRLLLPLGSSTELQLNLLAFDDRRRRGLPQARSEIDGHDLALRIVHRGPLPVEAAVWRQERDFRQTSVVADGSRTRASITADQFATPAAGRGGRIEIRPVAGERLRLALSVDAEQAEGRALEAYGFVAGQATGTRVAGGQSSRLGAMVDVGMAAGPGLDLGVTARVDRWWLGPGFRRASEGARPVLDETSPGRRGHEGSGHAALAWRPPGFEAWLLTAAVGRSFRLPTLNELHRPFRVGPDVTLANPELEPERLSSADAGLQWSPVPGMQLSAKLFAARLDGPIANVTQGQGPAAIPGLGFVPAGGRIRQRTNLDRLISQGVELEGRLRWGPWAMGGAAALVDARIVDASRGDVGPLGARPAQVPAFQASMFAQYRQAPFEGRLQLRHTGPRAEDDLGDRRLSAATTLDASAGLALAPGVRLFGEVENLFDSRVEVGFLGPLVERAQPRAWRLGLRLARGGG